MARFLLAGLALLLSWQANPEREQVRSYRVWDRGQAVCETTAPLCALEITPGEHAYTVTARSVYGLESEHSEAELVTVLMEAQ